MMNSHFNFPIKITIIYSLKINATLIIPLSDFLVITQIFVKRKILNNIRVTQVKFATSN